MNDLERVYPTDDGERLGCPDCGDTRFKFGPAGGETQNVECVGCETRWNATFIKGLPWERISTVWKRLEAKGFQQTIDLLCDDR